MKKIKRAFILVAACILLLTASLPVTAAHSNGDCIAGAEMERETTGKIAAALKQGGIRCTAIAISSGRLRELKTGTKDTQDILNPVVCDGTGFYCTSENQCPGGHGAGSSEAAGQKQHHGQDGSGHGMHNGHKNR